MVDQKLRIINKHIRRFANTFTAMIGLIILIGCANSSKKPLEFDQEVFLTNIKENPHQISIPELVKYGKRIIFGTDDPKATLAKGEAPIGKGQCPVCHEFLAEQKVNRSVPLLKNSGRYPEGWNHKFPLELRSRLRVKEERYKMFSDFHSISGEKNSGLKPHAETGGEYLIESLYCPGCYIVKGHGLKGSHDMISTMPILNKSPSWLNDFEIVAVVAYLQAMDTPGDYSKVTVLDDWEHYFGTKLSIPPDPPVARIPKNRSGRNTSFIGIESIIARLNNPDPFVRWVAVNYLQVLQINDPRVVELLIVALKDSEWGVRTIAAEALVKIKDPRAGELLIAALKDPEWHVRFQAAVVLGKIQNQRAVLPLINALNDKVWHVRAKAAESLGLLKDTRAVPPLIATLKDPEWDVRFQAAVVLGKIQNQRAVPPLINALNDKVWHVRTKAAESLGLLKDTRAVPPLIAALNDTVWRVQVKATEALGHFGDPRAVSPLIDALNDTVPNVRWKAAEALGKIKDPRAVEPLILALKDKAQYVRRNALEALGKMQEPRSVKLLINNLQEKDDYIRIIAARALGEIRDPRVITPLIKTLKDQNGDVRLGAAYALGRIGDNRAVIPLIGVLQDEVNFFVRREAVIALGAIQDSRAIKPIIALLEYKDQELHKYVFLSLKKITGQKFGPDPEKWQDWWEQEKIIQGNSPHPN